jgi:hypothetical protein
MSLHTHTHTFILCLISLCAVLLPSFISDLVASLHCVMWKKHQHFLGTFCLHLQALHPQRQ